LFQNEKTEQQTQTPHSRSKQNSHGYLSPHSPELFWSSPRTTTATSAAEAAAAAAFFVVVVVVGYWGGGRW
jgi:hypothetical protein